jgi:hypothetical protein
MGECRATGETAAPRVATTIGGRDARAAYAPGGAAHPRSVQAIRGCRPLVVGFVR